MFSRSNPLSAIRCSEGWTFKVRRQRSGGLRGDRTRRRLRLEGLEERCLLSYISSITEFSLPGGSSLSTIVSAITTGPDGNVWFTDPGVNAIGMINPTNHAISLFTIPTASAYPQGIAAGPDGNLWFAERGANAIGEINQTTHAISSYSIKNGLGGGPNNITAAPDGNIWFKNSEEIGDINPTTHAISVFALSPCCYTSAGGLTAGPDGNVWFAYAAVGEVGKINPTTHAITYFTIHGGADPSPVGIATGPDGNLWFADQGNSAVGMINPTTDAIAEFATPTAGSQPDGITTGPDGNLWFTEEVGKLGAINPTTDAITEYPVPYSGSSPSAITTGPDGNLWFTDPGTNEIGVATLSTSQLVVTTQPPATITAGSTFGLTVDAETSSGSLITSFNGTVTVALANNPGGGTLGGTLTATASGGVATFSGLSLTTAASGYSLIVSGGGYGEGITSAITVTPAAPTQLVITTEPPATVKLNAAFGLQASIEDQYGNIVTTDTNTVTVAFANNPTGATMSGKLSVAASQGVATFCGLEINKTGNGYTLEVTSSGLSSAVSTAIDVTKTGKAIVALSVTAGTTAADPLMAPLVLGSPDFLDSLGLKKRALGA